MSLTAPAGQVTAPPAPGRMGVEVQPTEALAYLDQLGRWRDERRTELDQLDEAALQAPNGSAATSDITLSMALWKAVSDRYEQLLATWDSGRVGPTERTRLANLIWGRLDAATASGLCRCRCPKPADCPTPWSPSCASGSDWRCPARRSPPESGSCGPRWNASGIRSTSSRPATPIRRPPRPSRDWPADSPRLADKAGRGGDVAGLLGPLEIEAATFERDLIVGGARRRDAAALVAPGPGDQRADLEAREAALRELVEECVRTVDPAPRYAVPDVELLGPVPNTAAQLEIYLRRLDQVGRAMSHAQDAYRQAIAEHEELGGRLDAYRSKAVAT